MGKYNFDKIIDRKNRGTLKTDVHIFDDEPSDVIPLWIADMDFETAPCIQTALKEMVEFDVFGYTDYKEKYFEKVVSWFKSQYDYDISNNDIVRTPGIIFALAMSVKAFTKENENIIIFNPSYIAFREVINYNNRNIIESDLVLENNKYHINFDDFEKKIKENNVKMLMFCSPHNPATRVWTKEEIIKVGKICIENNIIILSDEIHLDFVWGINKYIPFTEAFKDDKALYEKIKQITIVCTAPSKTFNIAGLQDSNIIIRNKDLKDKFQNQIDRTGYHRISQVAQIALMSAYTDSGREWLNELKNYLLDNIKYVKKYIEENIKRIKVIDTEGTYLMWLDFREFALTDLELQKKFIYEARVRLDNGLKFGSGGNGFMRMNIATNRKILHEALERMKKVFS